MRTAPATRQAAEIGLRKERWTVVKIPKDLMVVQSDKISDLTKWCEDNLGPGRIEPGHQRLDGFDAWYAVSWFGYWTFHFKREQDATMFILKWS